MSCQLDSSIASTTSECFFPRLPRLFFISSLTSILLEAIPFASVFQSVVSLRSMYSFKSSYWNFLIRLLMNTMSSWRRLNIRNTTRNRVMKRHTRSAIFSVSLNSNSSWLQIQPILIPLSSVVDITNRFSLLSSLSAICSIFE